MKEQELIANTDTPITKQQITKRIRELGVSKGDTVILHSSLSSIGWVSGGAPAVIDSFQTVLTQSGNLVMPTHTGHYGDPQLWRNPPVPEEWVEIIRDSIPPYRPEITPTRGNMGQIPECFRSYPNVHRSKHPVRSFAAWGADAQEIVANHDLSYGHNENSPLSSIYERDGKVVLLGVTQRTNTSIHLAEHLAEYDKETRMNGAPIIKDGDKTWVTFPEIIYPEDNPEQRVSIGEEFEDTYLDLVNRGMVGNAETVVLPQRELVDFSIDWFESHRM